MAAAVGYSIGLSVTKLLTVLLLGLMCLFGRPVEKRKSAF